MRRQLQAAVRAINMSTQSDDDSLEALPTKPEFLNFIFV